jgi:4-amino-4-deoxy-L-arabinose transferase-like glycosyltransferase
VLIRLACLLFAAAIARAGVVEESPPLIAVAALILGLALLGVTSACPDDIRRLKPTAIQKRPAFTRGVIGLVGIAAGLSVVSASGSGTSGALMFVALFAWVLTFVALGRLGLELDGLTPRDALAAVRSLFARHNRPELASVLAIMVVAAALRLYDLGTVPAAAHGDEGEVGRIAFFILEGQPYSYFTTAPYYEPVSYVVAGFIAILGPTVTALRMLSALAGVACVPLVYGIGRVGWGPLAGAMAAWLMAVSHLEIHYSRLAQVFMYATMATCATMLCLALAAQQAQRRALSLERSAVGDADGSPVSPGGSTIASGGAGVWTWMLLAGAMAGFAIHVYLAARIIPMVAGLLLLYLLYRRCIGAWHIVAFGFALLLVYGPMAVFYIDHPLDFMARTNSVSAFQEWYARETLGPDATLPRDLPALLVEQTRRTLGMFVTTGDWSGFYSSNLSSFDPLTAAMMWLGLAMVVMRLRRYHELALVLWIIITLVLGSVFILGARNGHRILIMTPAALLLGGVLIARGVELVRLTPLKDARWLVAPAGTSLALWLLAANVAIYFYGFVPIDQDAEPAMAARELVQDPRPYHRYLMALGRFDARHGAVSYITHGHQVTDLRNAADFTPPPKDGQGIVIVVLENYLNDLRVIEMKVPGGTESRVTAPTGRLMYIVYRVPPSE